MKEVVLLFSDEADEAVDLVAEWIASFGKSFRRIPSDRIFCDDLAFDITLGGTPLTIKIREKRKMMKVASVWIRKGFGNYHFDLSRIKNKELKQQVYAHLMKEFNESRLCFINLLKSGVPALGCIPSEKLNKPAQLLLAERSGLFIPETILTNSKRALLAFHARHKQIICKSVKDGTFFKAGEVRLGMYAEYLDRETIHSMDDYFVPSIIQRYIEAEFHIKSFYLNGAFYTVALFDISASQSADFRKNYTKSRLRFVPIRLPSETEYKLDLLMKKMELNIGTIDLIKSKRGNRIYFLEVNPAGEFGMISYYGNYHLEKVIASNLCFD